MMDDDWRQSLGCSQERERDLRRPHQPITINSDGSESPAEAFKLRTVIELVMSFKPISPSSPQASYLPPTDKSVGKYGGPKGRRTKGVAALEATEMAAEPDEGGAD